MIRGRQTAPASHHGTHRGGGRSHAAGTRRPGQHRRNGPLRHLSKRVLGLSLSTLREIARTIGRDHRVASALWRTGIHDARLLAVLIDDPAQVTRAQMERWAADFDSWALCDGACMHLFDRTPFAYSLARAWSRRRDEYTKRAGFALMASLAIHDRHAADRKFLRLLEAIERGAGDGRNFVKKAVSWALRQIGKRNVTLNRAAIEAARRLHPSESSSGRWIAADALRELRSPAVADRLIAACSGGCKMLQNRRIDRRRLTGVVIMKRTSVFLGL